MNKYKTREPKENKFRSNSVLNLTLFNPNAGKIEITLLTNSQIVSPISESTNYFNKYLLRFLFQLANVGRNCF